jgi:hypothetical protein
MALGNDGRIGDLSLEYGIPVNSPFREITQAGLAEIRTGPLDAVPPECVLDR